jgi:hypothetical protein
VTKVIASVSFVNFIVISLVKKIIPLDNFTPQKKRGVNAITLLRFGKTILEINAKKHATRREPMHLESSRVKILPIPTGSQEQSSNMFNRYFSIKPLLFLLNIVKNTRKVHKNLQKN